MLKGKVFSVDELSDSERRRLSTDEQEQRAAELTERYRIVATDPERADMPIIAEELDQRAIDKLSPRARRVAGMMLRLDPATRLEIIKAFDEEGGLVYPFAMTE